MATHRYEISENKLLAWLIVVGTVCILVGVLLERSHNNQSQPRPDAAERLQGAIH